MASGFPKPSETNEYYWKYISLVDSDDIVTALEEQSQKLGRFYQAIPEGKRGYAYADGKWSIMGSILHVIDAERIFAYRLLRFARGDNAALPGFDQDAYMADINEGALDWNRLFDEWRSTRAATISLLKSIRPDQWDRRGTASGLEHTVRALAYMLAGHELHHYKIIEERYLD
ncbi:MAG: DinB family protein [Saprospiraceae bacterium]|nr:DinB family protein [Saprospiraceae bacterium]